MLIEPIQGEGGFVVPAPTASCRRWPSGAPRHGALFIADEIQTGFCRTGDWFACEHEGVVPDLVTTAKGIAGGLPLAGVTGRAEIMDAVHPGGLGGTYGGNPVACAAALGAIATMESARPRGRGSADRVAGPCRGCRRWRKRPAGSPRSAAAGRCSRSSSPCAGSLEPDAAAAAAVAKSCHAAGVVVLTCGTYGNVIRLLPPLVIGEALLDEGLSVLEDSVAGLVRIGVGGLADRGRRPG